MVGLGLKQVVDVVVDVVVHLFLLVDHTVLVHHIDPVDLLLNMARVIRLGTRHKLVESRLHDVIVIQHIIVLPLVTARQVVEPLAVFVFHLLFNTEVSALSGLILEVDVAEIRVIDIHLADRSK
jgi:hypothetical protein